MPYLRRKRLARPAATVLEAVDTWLREYRPTVVLYFSGSKESAYQVNMWLDDDGAARRPAADHHA